MDKEDDGSPQPLFNEMVTFPNLREMEITSARCKDLWNNQTSTNSFCKLESLKLEDCDNLQHIAPSQIWKRLQRCLKFLKVRSCHSIEIIYESDGTVTKSSKLRSLNLRSLESLRHIWPYDGLPSVPFPKFSSIYVRSCPLEVLFPAFTAEFLEQIEMLEVRCCKNLELTAGYGECEEATETTITFSGVN
ncbi:uncharacterized protein LOC125315159 isoform X2 [Rhodamnia argentea]|uniref:Uncharacterized protein LOC125315159 isoform X2 n=1 Tax=Rhodamnia argentea TaxID=178133 RepID=A0ABM3HFH9_9MYRT|nr:uncharacterized protein LOC125315159 isoform X2 [Rhodamnia argentea]